jgi:hypothetical protein
MLLSCKTSFLTSNPGEKKGGKKFQAGVNMIYNWGKIILLALGSSPG